MHGNTPEDIELANSFSLVAAYDSVNIKGLGESCAGLLVLKVAMVLGMTTQCDSHITKPRSCTLLSCH